MGRWFELNQNEVEEFADGGSFNHGYLLIRLGILLDRLDAYTAVGDVSLDVSSVDLSKFDLKTREEIKPDVCLYPKRGLLQPKDILKMKEMPLLAVEILSPKQGLYDIVEKFRPRWLMRRCRSSLRLMNYLCNERLIAWQNQRSRLSGWASSAPVLA